MFALAAAIVFAVALFHGHVGSFDLVILGLLLLAVHFVVGGAGVSNPFRR